MLHIQTTDHAVKRELKKQNKCDTENLLSDRNNDDHVETDVM